MKTNNLLSNIRTCMNLLFIMIIGAAYAQDIPATCEQNCPAPYVKNEFWTTEYGTASANIILTTTNFLSCSSSAYALCYYSGPAGTTTGKEGKTLPALPCKISKNNPGFAICKCPTYTGPFQIGPTDLSCDLGNGNIWSASYTPPSQ